MKLEDLVYSANLALYTFSKGQDFKKVLIAVNGNWKGHTNGLFEIDKNMMENVLENFNNQKIDLVCDYEHQTITKTDGPAPASGWIKSLSIEDDKLYAFIDWNEQAKEHIQNREYRYVSPVFSPNTIDRVTGKNTGWSLHSLALTNRPFLEELGEVFLNSKDDLIDLKQQIEDLKIKNQSLEEELKKYKEKDLKNVVDNAVKDGKIDESQSAIALKLANMDMQVFDEFVNSNKGTRIYPNLPSYNDMYITRNTNDNMYMNKNRNQPNSDIEYMVKIASQQ
jgi:phage I-like protein